MVVVDDEERKLPSLFDVWERLLPATMKALVAFKSSCARGLPRTPESYVLEDVVDTLTSLVNELWCGPPPGWVGPAEKTPAARPAPGELDLVQAVKDAVWAELSMRQVGTVPAAHHAEPAKAKGRSHPRAKKGQGKR
jgi:hypothetical protein